MAYAYHQIFAADPSSPGNIAANSYVTIFAEGDPGKTPLPLTTLDGDPLPNPVLVNSSGFGPAFMQESYDLVAWEGGGKSGLFISYEGMKQEAVEARTAAQAAADSAAAAAGDAISTAAVDGSGQLILTKASGVTVQAGTVIGPAGPKGDKGADGSNVLPTNDAVAQAVTTDGPTKAALNATILDGLLPTRSDALRSTFAPASPSNRPTITIHPSASSPLATSGGTLHTIKRVGANTTAADIAGDTKFLFDGTPSMEPAASDNAFVEPPLLPGGTSQAAYYAYTIATTITGTQVEFLVRAGATSFAFRAYVNGQPLSLPRQVVNGLTAGSWYTIRFQFATAATRVVKLAPAGSTPVRGAYLPTSETPVRPAGHRLRIAILGDSYEGGSGVYPTGGGRIETAGMVAAHMLGADSIWNFGIGGTGYTATVNTFSTRTAAILAANPDIVIVSGSINDGTSDTPALRTAVTNLLSALASVPEVYVTGPSLSTAYTGNNTAVREATVAAGRTYLDPLNPTPWLTPAMIGADNAHPTQAGHMRRAMMIYQGISAARELVGYTLPAALAPYVAPAIFADDFERVSTNIAGTNTPTGGKTWVGQSAGNATYPIDSGAASISLNGDAEAFILADAGQTDGTATATLRTRSTSRAVFITRYLDVNNYLRVAVSATGQWIVGQKVAGTLNAAVSGDLGAAANGDIVKFVMAGTTGTVSINGVQKWTGTVAATTGTKAGFSSFVGAEGQRWEAIDFYA